MSKLLRFYSEGNIYFITAVTHKRKGFLIEHFDLLWSSVQKYQNELLFDIKAWVVLPDHFHMVVDPNDTNLSLIIQKIKLSFSKKVKYERVPKSESIWQKRFWDHIIRDQNDLNNHINYIHYNPLKHHYIDNPSKWEFSSMKDYIKRGVYLLDWGTRDVIQFDGNYGE